MTSSPLIPDRDDLSIGLIHRARAGEQQALNELIETWRTYLLHVTNGSLGRQLQGKLGASDIVQSACLEIHKHFGEFRGDSVQEWKSWLRNMLVRDIQDARRRFQGVAKRNVKSERSLVDESGAAIDLPADGVTPCSSLIAEEESVALRRALRRLSDEHDVQYKSIAFGEELIKEMVMASVFGVPLSTTAAMTGYRLAQKLT